MYYGGFSYGEIYNLPIPFKRWFIERIVKELNKGGDDKGGGDNPQPMTKALHQNTPEVRALQGNQRQQTPARLRRFT